MVHELKERKREREELIVFTELLRHLGKAVTVFSQIFIEALTFACHIHIGIQFGSALAHGLNHQGSRTDIIRGC